VTAVKEGALVGLRVVDLSRILAAPFATQMLGDLGADVIKVERPGAGDEARLYGPDYIVDTDGRSTRESSFYVSANRNKRSITVELSTPEGRDIVCRLVERADVLVENFLPGTTARFGLDYQALRAINPRLIYCSVTGYGQEGPYRDRPGFDAVFQAQGGLMAVTGLADELPGGGPMKVGPSIVDVVTGHNVAAAIMGALLYRERVSGRGQHIDIALLDVAVAMQAHMAQNYLLSGKQPQRQGTSGNGGHPARVFRCSDGDIYISAGTQRHYIGLCEVLGRPDLVNDPDFLDTAARWRNRERWNAIAEPVISAWKVAVLAEALVAAKVPCSRINDYRGLFEDLHARVRGLAVDVEHPLSSDGRVQLVASPLRLSETPVQYRRPPMMGEQTEEVLREELGMDAADIARLREAGAI